MLNFGLPKQVQSWRALGKHYVLDTLFPSCLVAHEIEALPVLLRKHIGKFTIAMNQIIEEETAIFSPIVIQRLVQEIQAVASQSKIPLLGRYFRILTAIDEPNNRLAFDQKVEKFRNILVVHYGYGAALPIAQSVVHDLTNGNLSAMAISSMIEISGNPSVDDRYLCSVEGLAQELNEHLDLSPEGSRFFSAALASIDSNDRFSFFWLCLENLTGNGKERKAFFERQLGSSAISAEVLRLFHIRNAIFHDGSSNVTVYDLRSVREAIRIAATKDIEKARIIARVYEAFLLGSSK